MTHTPDLRIAFIGVMTFEDGSIRGGILITDDRTRPHEFRVSEPVKPSAFQKILYGRTLNESLHVDLIAARLLETTKENVSVILTVDEPLLALRPRISYPIAWLQRQQGADPASPTNVVRIEVHKDFSTEKNWIEGIIRQLSVVTNIFEPFERLGNALMEVHKLRPEDR